MRLASFVVDSSVCTSCPAGKASPSLGAASLSICTECAASYSPSSSLSDCIDTIWVLTFHDYFSAVDYSSRTAPAGSVITLQEGTYKGHVTTSTTDADAWFGIIRGQDDMDATAILDGDTDNQGAVLRIGPVSDGRIMKVRERVCRTPRPMRILTSHTSPLLQLALLVAADVPWLYERLGK